jgi:hypothetical protein
MRRKLLLTLIILSGIVLSALVINRLFYATLLITIEAEHDPVTSHVFIDNERLYPRGEGGKQYQTRTRPGTKTITISGPFVETSKTSAELQLLSQKKIALQPKILNPEQILGKLVNLEGRTIISSSIYGDATWLSLLVNQKDQQREAEIFVLRYRESAWEIIGSGVKINAAEVALTEAPAELITYLRKAADD